MKSLPLLSTAGLISTQLYAEESQLTMTLDSFDIGKSETAMGQLEYRFSTDWSGLRPKVDLFFTADSGGYLYTGVEYL